MIIISKRKEDISGNVEEIQAILFGSESDDDFEFSGWCGPPGSWASSPYKKLAKFGEILWKIFILKELFSYNFHNSYALSVFFFFFSKIVAYLIYKN